MRKRGIQFIGVFFVIWAISSLVGVITGSDSSQSFLGISAGINYTGRDIGVMGWVGVYVLTFTGYHLLNLNEQGRTWALVVLWVAVINSGLSIILYSIVLISSHALSKEISMTLHLFNGTSKIDNPTSILLITGFYLFFYAAQVYFLMSKGVRSEFQKQEISKEKS